MKKIKNKSPELRIAELIKQIQDYDLSTYEKRMEDIIDGIINEVINILAEMFIQNEGEELKKMVCKNIKCNFYALDEIYGIESRRTRNILNDLNVSIKRKNEEYEDLGYDIIDEEISNLVYYSFIIRKVKLLTTSYNFINVKDDEDFTHYEIVCYDSTDNTHYCQRIIKDSEELDRMDFSLNNWAQNQNIERPCDKL